MNIDVENYETWLILHIIHTDQFQVDWRYKWEIEKRGKQGLHNRSMNMVLPYV